MVGGNRAAAMGGGWGLALRRGMILICVGAVLVPVLFAVMRLFGVRLDKQGNVTPVREGGGTTHHHHHHHSNIRRTMQVRQDNGQGGGLLHHHHHQRSSNDGEGPVLLSPVGPQVSPRYHGVGEAKHVTTRSNFRRDNLLINAVIGQVLRHNRLQESVYDNMGLYARLQQRAEDPVFRTRFRTALLAQYPAFYRMRAQVRDPDFQRSLQQGIYRNANMYNGMARRVDDPAFTQRLQQSLYALTLRPTGESNLQINREASQQEAAGYKRGPHVP